MKWPRPCAKGMATCGAIVCEVRAKQKTQLKGGFAHVMFWCVLNVDKPISCGRHS